MKTSQLFSQAQIVAVSLVGTGPQEFFRLDVETSSPFVLSIQINIPNVEEAIQSIDLPTWNGTPIERLIVDAVLDRDTRLAAPSTDTPQ